MKVVVFGANGRVGTLVVQRLLNEGHTVRAFVHSDAAPIAHNNIETVEGDIHNAKEVTAAVQGTDAVISTLGSWGTPTKDILTVAMQTIIPAMKQYGVMRIVSLTGAGARDPIDKPGLLDRLNRFAIRLAASKILLDGENHIALLRDSELNWTVVRSPAMRPAGQSSSHILSSKAPAPWATIAREEVANAIVGLVTRDEWLQSSPYIRKK